MKRAVHLLILIGVSGSLLIGDTARAGALSVAQSDINSTLAAAWSPFYINDFIDRGRVKRVFMQGDAPFRTSPDDLGRWYVRSSAGDMAPFSSFSTIGWTTGPVQLQRYNGMPAFDIQGQAAKGKSSGTAMKEMEKLVAKLPRGVGFEWTGLSYQERQSGAQAPMLYAVSLVFGLSQGGIVPCYAIIVREYMPAKEAGQRVGIVIMATIFGMAIGGWMSGWIYDLTGSYSAAFLNGIAWNLLNILVMVLVFWKARRGGVAVA